MNKSGEQMKQTTVEEGTEFRGTLSSTCPVVVRGVLDGEIRAPSLTVAATGTVIGTVRAQRIESEGVLAGHVDANDVSLSGRVRSDTVIRAKTLEVKLKHDTHKLEVTFGECKLEVGDEPSLEASAPRRSPQLEAASAQAREAELYTGEPAEANGRSQRPSVPPPG